jgi:hypothetical protein
MGLSSVFQLRPHGLMLVNTNETAGEHSFPLREAIRTAAKRRLKTSDMGVNHLNFIPLFRLKVNADHRTLRCSAANEWRRASWGTLSQDDVDAGSDGHH